MDFCMSFTIISIFTIARLKYLKSIFVLIWNILKSLPYLKQANRHEYIPFVFLRRWSLSVRVPENTT